MRRNRIISVGLALAMGAGALTLLSGAAAAQAVDYDITLHGDPYASPWESAPLAVVPDDEGDVLLDEDHVTWCLDRYRSYDPETDTFMGYDGLSHECVSPFS